MKKNVVFFFIILNFFIYCSKRTNFDTAKGYFFNNDKSKITFIYNPSDYKISLSPDKKVYVAGSFNGWAEAKFKPYWYLKYDKTDKLYKLTVPVDSVMKAGDSDFPEFKFVISPSGWQVLTFIPQQYQKNGNLWINLNENKDDIPPIIKSYEITKVNEISIHFNEPISNISLKKEHFDIKPILNIKNLALSANKKTILITTDSIDLKKYNYLSPYRIFLSNIEDLSGNVIKKAIEIEPEFSRDVLRSYFLSLIPSDKYAPGIWESGNNVIFRLFGPRLTDVKLLFFKKYDDSLASKEVSLSLVYPGIWEVKVSKRFLLNNKYYKYRIYKNKKSFIISDPYARANIRSNGKSIYVPIDNFKWTDKNYRTPLKSNIIIYETHIVDLTYKNLNVPDKYKGKFLALTLDAEGTPLDHLKKLGINAIEFLPIEEISNGYNDDITKNFHWGYMTSLYFVPESDYIIDFKNGSHLEEFRKMVDFLHKNGIAVILDVVYNHTANIDGYFKLIDEKYFYTGTNFSYCGNDFNCKMPYVKKFIMDNLKYWVKYGHVDGFRFDMSHRMNQEEILSIENIKELNRVKPTKGELILIAENWAEKRDVISGRGVAQWNDQFRNRVKNFLVNKSSNFELYSSIRWSYDKGWYKDPLESINYLESHDEETVINFLKEFKHDTEFIKTRAKLGALILAISTGIPMILEGQEFGRDKVKQTQDFETNCLHWDKLVKNNDLLEYYRRLFLFRKSFDIFHPEKDPGDLIYYKKNLPDGVFHGIFKDKKGIFELLINLSSGTHYFDIGVSSINFVVDKNKVYFPDMKKVMLKDKKISVASGDFILLKTK